MDLRNRTAFAADHLAGTAGFEPSGSFAAYLGRLYTWGAPLTVVGESTTHSPASIRRRNSSESTTAVKDKSTGSGPFELMTPMWA